MVKRIFFYLISLCFFFIFLFKTKGCGRNFHKRCVSDLPDNCSPMARKISDVALPHDDVKKKISF
jgi:hypothetical protein